MPTPPQPRPPPKLEVHQLPSLRVVSYAQGITGVVPVIERGHLQVRVYGVDGFHSSRQIMYIEHKTSIHASFSPSHACSINDYDQRFLQGRHSCHHSPLCFQFSMGTTY
jgi:hypothetical protein